MLHGFKTFYVIFDKVFVKNRWFTPIFYGLHAFSNIYLIQLFFRGMWFMPGFVYNKCTVLVIEKKCFPPDWKYS